MDAQGRQNASAISSEKIVLIVCLLCVGFISTFVAGFIIAMFLSKEAIPVPNTTPAPTPTIVKNPDRQVPSSFLPGKFYFEDTIIAITSDTPHTIITATVTRHEKSKTYLQNSRVSYFDGKEWARSLEIGEHDDASIASDALVKQWDIDLDPSLVLQESVKGEVHIQNTKIEFATDTLENEISMRSLPGYTKFMSTGTGKIGINGVFHPAYMVYTRIYSFNEETIQFFDSSLKSVTDWIAFWDTEGNFYHVDSTTVEKPTTKYQTHQIGVYVQNKKTVSKTFSTTISRNSLTDPTAYTVDLPSPIDAVLTFTRTSMIDKNGGNATSTWLMGGVEGTVKNAKGREISGVGLVEYIKD